MPFIPVITLDGPSASGKGAVAQLLAKTLQFHYLDSGLIYRLTALAARRANIDLQDEARLAQLASALDIQFDGEEIRLNQAPVGAEVRGEACGADASTIAVLPAVRVALLARQRAFRQSPGLVAEGRDMGSVVFPEANLKIYLDASAEIRALRRYKQLKEKGMYANLEEILHGLIARDARDCTRSFAPLQKAADTFFLDNSELTVAQTTDVILQLYKEKVSDLAS